MRLALLVVGCAACFELPSRHVLDARGVTGDALMCDGPAHWSAPRDLTELDMFNTDELGPWLSRDGLELWFDGTLAPGVKSLVYRAVRSDPTMPFGFPVHVPELDSNEQEELFLSDDLLTAWFVHMGTNFEIQTAVRGQRDGTFGSASDIAIDSPGSDVTDPSVTSDGLTMVYSVSQPNGAGDLYLAGRGSAQEDFSGMVPIPNVNDPAADDCCGSLSGDGNTLLFASNRSGKYKIYVATRPDAMSPFGAPALFEGQNQNSPYNNTSPALGRDGLTVVFASNGGSGGTSNNLFVTQLTCGP